MEQSLLPFLILITLIGVGTVAGGSFLPLDASNAMQGRKKKGDTHG